MMRLVRNQGHDLMRLTTTRKQTIQMAMAHRPIHKGESGCGEWRGTER